MLILKITIRGSAKATSVNSNRVHESQHANILSDRERRSANGHETFITAKGTLICFLYLIFYQL